MVHLVLLVFSVAGQKYRIRCPNIDVRMRGRKYKKGDEIFIFYDPANPNENVPFLPSVAKIIYPRKEINDAVAHLLQ